MNINAFLETAIVPHEQQQIECCWSGRSVKDIQQFMEFVDVAS